jgi:hypothetical protein
MTLLCDSIRLLSLQHRIDRFMSHLENRRHTQLQNGGGYFVEWYNSLTTPARRLTRRIWCTVLSLLENSTGTAHQWTESFRWSQVSPFPWEKLDSPTQWYNTIYQPYLLGCARPRERRSSMPFLLRAPMRQGLGWCHVHSCCLLSIIKWDIHRRRGHRKLTTPYICWSNWKPKCLTPLTSDTLPEKALNKDNT